jgi:hypothetical protein
MRQAIEAHMWQLMNIRISAGASSGLFSSHWMRGIIEMSQSGGMTYITWNCREINNYLFELFEWRWSWDYDRNDYKP